MGERKLKCRTCGQTKGAGEFRGDARRRSGLEPDCMPCSAAARAAAPPPARRGPDRKERQRAEALPADGGEGEAPRRNSAQWIEMQRRAHMEKSRARAKASAEFAARNGG